MQKNGLIAVVVIAVVLVIGAVVVLGKVKAPDANKAEGGNGVKGTNAANAESNESQDFTIKANVNKDCAGTPWFVGQQKGFFEKSGVNFVDKGHLDWAQQSAALISGQTNVADAHPNTIINLIKEGGKVKGVVATGDEPKDDVQHEHMHWLVKEDSPLKGPEDIKNADKPVKVAVGALGICSDLETNAWLRKNGIPKDKIEFVVLADPLQEQALRNGEIDVANLHPPFYTAAETVGGVRPLFTSREAFGDAAGLGLLYFTEDFIDKNPEAVKRFIKGFSASEVWSNDNPEESADITAKEIGLKKSTTHWYSYSGEIIKQQIQQWIDAMVADGQLKQGEFKPEDLYTNDFESEWGEAKFRELIN